MKEVTAYQCADGSIHEDERKAKAHEDDLLGAELDGFLRLFELDITRNQEFRAILTAMKKRAELLEAAQAIAKILEHKETTA
jgi:hypothetical protein